MGMTLRKRIFFGIAIAAAVTGALWWLFTRSGNVPGSKREIATRMLADYLGEKKPVDAVLVISNPFAENPGHSDEAYKSQQAVLGGLKAGFGQGVEIIVAPAELHPVARENPASIPIDPSSKTPLSFLITQDTFDNLIQEHPECPLVISLIGVPVNLSRVKAWTTAGPPHFALLLPDWRMIGNTSAILQAFTSGKLAAAIVENPQPDPSRPYLLVTPENIQELLRTHTNLFTP